MSQLFNQLRSSGWTSINDTDHLRAYLDELEPNWPRMDQAKLTQLMCDVGLEHFSILDVSAIFQIDLKHVVDAAKPVDSTKIDERTLRTPLVLQLQRIRNANVPKVGLNMRMTSYFFSGERVEHAE